MLTGLRGRISTVAAQRHELQKDTHPRFTSVRAPFMPRSPGASCPSEVEAAAGRRLRGECDGGIEADVPTNETS